MIKFITIFKVFTIINVFLDSENVHWPTVYISDFSANSKREKITSLQQSVSSRQIFFLFKKEMSSGDYLDNFEDEEEFSDDDDDVRESKNFYNEGLGLGHVRRLEQENEVSRANSTDRELKLIGKYFLKIKL